MTNGRNTVTFIARRSICTSAIPTNDKRERHETVEHRHSINYNSIDNNNNDSIKCRKSTTTTTNIIIIISVDSASRSGDHNFI
jgi:hypothetical protein